MQLIPGLSADDGHAMISLVPVQGVSGSNFSSVGITERLRINPGGALQGHRRKARCCFGAKPITDCTVRLVILIFQLQLCYHPIHSSIQGTNRLHNVSGFIVALTEPVTS